MLHIGVKMAGLLDLATRLTLILLIATGCCVNVTAQNREVDKQLLNKKLSFDNSTECRWCNNLMDQLETLRPTSATSNSDLLNLFKHACQTFPSETPAEREECTFRLAKNAQKFRKVLEQDASGLKLCEHLHFCKQRNVNQNDAVRVLGPSAHKHPDSTSNPGAYCNSCVNFAERGHTKFFENYAGPDYTKLIKQLCGYIKNTFVNAMCHVIADLWDETWMIHQLVLDPIYLCRTLELCTDGQVDGEEPVDRHKTTCGECKDMLEYYKDVTDVSSFGLDERVIEVAKAACEEHEKKQTEICERQFLAAMPTTLRRLSEYIEPQVIYVKSLISVASRTSYEVLLRCHCVQLFLLLQNFKK